MAPVLLFCSDGRKYILLKAKVVDHLPLITTEELAVLLSAINACTTTGTLWDRQQWSRQLGRDFATYGNSDVESALESAYPPVTTAPPVDASDNEAQTIEVSQFPTSATVAQPSAQDEPLTFRLEDQDAPTEPEIPISLEAMHASVTTEDARRILLDHPLPRARQRTNVCTEDTRGEGMTQALSAFLWLLLQSCAWLLLEAESTLTRGSYPLNSTVPLHSHFTRIKIITVIPG